MWILWWRFRKAYAVPRDWGGTDRLGALYEWRVNRSGLPTIRPERGARSVSRAFPVEVNATPSPRRVRQV